VSKFDDYYPQPPDYEQLHQQVFGPSDTTPGVMVDFKQIEYKGERYFRAVDVADMLETMGANKTARHIREQVM
jgi:hypothetical protein